MEPALWFRRVSCSCRGVGTFSFLSRWDIFYQHRKGLDFSRLNAEILLFGKKRRGKKKRQAQQAWNLDSGKAKNRRGLANKGLRALSSALAMRDGGLPKCYALRSSCCERTNPNPNGLNIEIIFPWWSEFRRQPLRAGFGLPDLINAQLPLSLCSAILLLVPILKLALQSMMAAATPTVLPYLVLGRKKKGKRVKSKKKPCCQLSPLLLRSFPITCL